MARHSFQPRNSLFPCFSLHFPTLQTIFREIFPTFPPSALPFLHCAKAFRIQLFPFFILCSTFLFPLISFPPLIPPPFTSFLHFFSHSSPLFHLPPQLTHERAHPRAIRTCAYACTYPHVRRFSFFSFTASPTPRNPLYINILGVKENKKKPSQNTQQYQNQHLTTNVRFHPP